MKHPDHTFGLLVISLVLSVGCSAADSDTHTIRADIWADNWFALYAGDELVIEDSVPYNTERSFNKESLEFDVELPAQLSFVIKDFKENDTGLEYIGTSRQQIGDGGFSAQFFDAAKNELLAVSDSDWRCITIHQAPLNRSCVRSSTPENDCGSQIGEEPEGWKRASFDDSDWPNAVEHTAQDVRPRHGYEEVSWHTETRLIWTDSLETDNTVLCRFTIQDARRQAVH
jgi:hypothetical protein